MCLIAFYGYNIHKILAWFFAIPFYFLLFTHLAVLFSLFVFLNDCCGVATVGTIIKLVQNNYKVNCLFIRLLQKIGKLRKHINAGKQR